jgi:hypothetical protein
MSKTALLLPLLALFVGRAGAQALESIKSQEELDKVVTSLDAALFDAYNRCDLMKFSSLLDDDMEFYHDQGGVTLGKEKMTESVKKNICGGDVRRELVPGTLQVYYMKGYGAVETGVHRFYHPKVEHPARRSPVRDPLAIQGRRLEDHPRHQLRPPPCGQVRAATTRARPDCLRTPSTTTGSPP